MEMIPVTVQVKVTPGEAFVKVSCRDESLGPSEIAAIFIESGLQILKQGLSITGMIESVPPEPEQPPNDNGLS